MTQYFTCLVTNTLSPIYLRPTGQQQRLSLELPRFYKKFFRFVFNREVGKNLKEQQDNEENLLIEMLWVL
jgi:hypothetical protein